MAKRKSRGLGGVAKTPESLRTQTAACGNHYFSPSTMRFFNSKLVSVHPAPARGATYFVVKQGGDKSDPAFSRVRGHYAIGVFKGCKVRTLGKGKRGGISYKTYPSEAAAKKVARAIAKKGGG